MGLFLCGIYLSDSALQHIQANKNIYHSYMLHHSNIQEIYKLWQMGIYTNLYNTKLSFKYSWIAMAGY